MSKVAVLKTISLYTFLADNIYMMLTIPFAVYGLLPTVKTHGHTTTTGAMKDAFGGVNPKYRHHAHKKIHEILVDLLAIQKGIHKGIFAVMDGCVCGNGAGPRTMEPFTGNVILASKDQVAIDAIAAKIMGFETFIFASEFYHDWFWYPLIGKRKIKGFMKSGWGEVFKNYPYGEFPEYTEVKAWDPY